MFTKHGDIIERVNEKAGIFADGGEATYAHDGEERLALTARHWYQVSTVQITRS